MLAKRQPLLWAFVGGGLLGAALIGFLGKETASMPSSPRTPTAVDRIADALATIATTRAAREQSTPGDDDRTATKVEPAPRKVADEVDGGSAAEAGSSVADVLTQMEAAYRERLAAAAPAAAASGVAGTDVPVASSEPRPATPERGGAAPPATTPASDVSGPVVPAEGPLAVAAPPAPARNAPPAAPYPAAAYPAPPAFAPPVEGAPVLAASDAPPARDVYLGNVTQNNYAGGFTQNTYTGNPHQTDAALTQQIAMLQYMQYMQLLSLSSPYVGVRFGARGARGIAVASPVSVPAPAPFKSTLTNPDNPWGFDFPPTPLTH